MAVLPRRRSSWFAAGLSATGIARCNTVTAPLPQSADPRAGQRWDLALRLPQGWDLVEGDADDLCLAQA